MLPSEAIPQTGKEGGVTMPGAASLLTGVITGQCAALWFGTSASGAVGIVQIMAALASATVAALATGMGGLMVSDWQVDMQSRRDWAQLGLTPAELSTSIQGGTAWEINPSYQNSATNEAVLAILRAHRAVQPVQPESLLAPEPTVPPLPSEEVKHTEKLLRGAVRRHALSRPIIGRNVRMLRAKLHVKRTVLPARLVANGVSWQEGVAQELSTPKPVALSPGSTAEIITLSSSGDGKGWRPAEAERVTDHAAEIPSCRGPPSLKQRRSTLGAAIGVGRAGAATRALRDEDLLVHDDLGHPVPVCATEIEVIETYLGDVLEELFATTRTSPKSERA